MRRTSVGAAAAGGALMVVAALLFSLGAGGVASGDDVPPPPPPPPWVNPDGTVDLDRMPDRVPIMNEEGEIIGEVEIDKGPCVATDRAEKTEDGGTICWSQPFSGPGP